MKWGIHMTRVFSGEQHNWCDGAADRGLWILANLGLVDYLFDYLSCVYMYSNVHSPGRVVASISQILRTRYGDHSRASLPYWKIHNKKMMARLLSWLSGRVGGAEASLSLACNQPATRQFDAEPYRCVSKCVANKTSGAKPFWYCSVEW
jgi:hypothetical protein